MTGLVAYLALVVTVPALLLGHQGQDWPVRWRRPAQGAAGARKPLSACLRAEVPESGPRDVRASDRRSAPRWARASNEDTEPPNRSRAA